MNALKLPDSLIFTSTLASNNCTVVWHPGEQRYYSLRIGAAGFPLETWVAGNSTSVCGATTAIDTRGMWYNPYTNAIERNCLGALGWATFGIDGASCATGASTIILPGLLQATAQSCAAFDPVLSQVLTYAAGTTSVQFRDRATGALAQTLLLSGITFTNINTESIIWTGQAGYEIGLLEWATKRVLLFSRATGAFTGQSQLPASAVTHSQFRFCYTNNRVWLYTSATRKWNAYCIWTEQCSILLPVELIQWDAECEGKAVHLTWTTATELNSSHFAVERSQDATAWEVIGEVLAAGNSQHQVEYRFSDPRPLNAPLVYYRLRQVDRDGREELFRALTVANCSEQRTSLLVQPNPASYACEVLIDASMYGEEPLILLLRDGLGRSHGTYPVPGDQPVHRLQLELQHLASGSYQLILTTTTGRPLARTTLIH